MKIENKHAFIEERIAESIRVKKGVSPEVIEKCSGILIEALGSGKKVLFCGNGGSAADAQHFAAELVVRFKIDRKGLPAIALSSDPSIVTAASNDYGYERVFERQVEAYGTEGDVLVAISTSGRSKNVNLAVRKAYEMGMRIIYFTGKNDIGELEKVCDVVIHVPSDNTARIQEAHEMIGHIMLEIVERELFG